MKKILKLSSLAAYLVLLCLTSLWPTPVDSGGFVWSVTSTVLKFCHSVSWLSWLQYNQLEAIANALLYLPMGVYLVWLLPKLKLTLLFLLPAGISIGAELIQRFFLPARYSTWDDVINNSIGAMLGILISIGIRRLTQRKAEADSA